jgi:biofilm protein TabA
MCNLANKKIMRSIILNIMILTSILGLIGCSGSGDPSKWNSEKTDKWFEKGEWQNGWNIPPDQSVSRTALSKAYFKNSDRWNKAFAFLKEADLAKLELRRHDLDGDNLFVMVSEYNTKKPEDARYEAHRKYIDIQYVVSGSELIGIAPLTSKEIQLQEYDPAKDIEFFSVKDGKNSKATPAGFFIFFPENAHMPGLNADSIAPVRKVVVKIRID